MCLILFAFHAHEKYKLIVAANRDEFYKRPTLPIHYWDDQPEILAGRDLHKMGTWMGITRNGKFAGLTNYRNPNEKNEGKRSRGELVSNFLSKNMSPHDFMNELDKMSTLYPGFNLIAGTINELFYYSNVERKVKKIEPGIYGVSNHLLNTNWPKVSKGKEELERMISNRKKEEMTDNLFQILQSADPFPDEMLPNTGVSLEWERKLSPIFIKSDGYGTRSSTVLLMSEDEIMISERVYANNEIDQKEYKINI